MMKVTAHNADISQLTDHEIDLMYSIVIKAYAATEVEIWGENYTRIPKNEFIKLVQQGEVIIAKYNKKIVGSIHVSKHTENSHSFGLLAADFMMKGLGIGDLLIRSAEERAQMEGSDFMDIEILKPQDSTPSFKKFLADYYIKRGYIYSKTMKFEDRKPEEVKKLKNIITPSIFECYRKELG